jgi:hypothetical protein
MAIETRFHYHQKFIESSQRLSVSERDSVARFIKMLQQGNITPGMRPHNVGVFLSLSPNMDLRVISSKEGNDTTLLYVDHHDAAYQWAKDTGILDTKVGKTELVNIRDLPSLLGNTDIDDEVALPIPVQDLLNLEDEDAFLQAIQDMSPEWQEWLFDIYIDDEATVTPPLSSSLVFSPTNDMELEGALNLKIPYWRLFLHPTQHEIIRDLSSQSIAIKGGPGTGKTVVLLNRVIEASPKGKDKECNVLLTYSQGLAGYLKQILKNFSSRYYYVFPLYFLGGDLPYKSYDRSVYRKIGLEIKNGYLIVRYQNGNTRHVRELLVDELQDAPPDVLNKIKTLISSGTTRVVLAEDSNQSIHRANQTKVDSVVALCEKHYTLSYCYRSTKQIIEKGIEWRSALGLKPSTKKIYALSGPQVRFVSCKDLNHQVQITSKVMRDLSSRYDDEGLALVYGQYYNPSFKGKSKEEEVLKKHPYLKDYYRFASVTKGREYFAGVIFISKTFLSIDMGERANELRVNTLYVAMTRFRDEVTIVYPSGCAIEDSLNKLAMHNEA